MPRKECRPHLAAAYVHVLSRDTLCPIFVNNKVKFDFEMSELFQDL